MSVREDRLHLMTKKHSVEEVSQAIEVRCPSASVDFGGREGHSYLRVSYGDVFYDINERCLVPGKTPTTWSGIGWTDDNDDIVCPGEEFPLVGPPKNLDPQSFSDLRSAAEAAIAHLHASQG